MLIGVEFFCQCPLPEWATVICSWMWWCVLSYLGVACQRMLFLASTEGPCVSVPLRCHCGRSYWWDFQCPSPLGIPGIHFTCVGHITVLALRCVAEFDLFMFYWLVLPVCLWRILVFTFSNFRYQLGWPPKWVGDWPSPLCFLREFLCDWAFFHP